MKIPALPFRPISGALLLLGACAPIAPAAVTSSPYGALPDGTPVTRYVLDNGRAHVELIDYGATVTKLLVPDAAGKQADVVLGFDSLDGYLGAEPFFGATIGRCANRIAGGSFSLDGKEYKLALSDKPRPNSLHGGDKGFDKRMWKGEPIPGENAVRFTRTSPDGEEGYPGTLRAAVVYRLSGSGKRNALEIELSATTDKPTLVNLTHHGYFNLAGEGSGTILDHVLQIDAARYTPVDAALIPTGERKSLDGTPFDFRRPEQIGARIAQAGGDPVGYDHNYVLDGSGLGLHKAAVVTEPSSGRRLTVRTDQPGIQFYSGNFLDGTLKGKGGHAYPQYGAFCLEPQKFPDAIHHPGFPSVVLRPGETYRSRIVYAFDTTPSK
ncbi:MAG TPA: aldose epimerase family protein [Candidatus Methylacidiphilales bacterium]